jgi:hypothetical protein
MSSCVYFFNYYVHLHLTQFSGMEEDLVHVEPIWISEEKQEHLPQVKPSWIPQTGLEFESLSSVDIFWKYYGGRMSFSTRKKYENNCKQNGVVTSCRFICAKQGLRGNERGIT